MDYNSYRRKTTSIRVGNMTVGGSSPVSVQSMTNTDTHDVDVTYSQVRALAAAGCDIVRIAAPDVESAECFRALKARGATVPLVADTRPAITPIAQARMPPITGITDKTIDANPIIAAAIKPTTR